MIHGILRSGALRLLAAATSTGLRAGLRGPRRVGRDPANAFNNAINSGVRCTDDQGNPILTDQRGFARTEGIACDAGAYEFDPDRSFTNGFD